MERNIPRNPAPAPVTPPPAAPIPVLPPAAKPPAGDRPAPGMTGLGKLIFQVTTAGGAIPLEGAEVTLRASRAAPSADGDVIAVLYSDRDGKTELLTLPAPARSLSLEPARDGAPVPYALYNADIRLEGFSSQSYIRIPVFDGITSIQRASLIPLPENGFEGGVRAHSEVFVEDESPDL